LFKYKTCQTITLLHIYFIKSLIIFLSCLQDHRANPEDAGNELAILSTIQTIRYDLRDILWITNFFLEDTSISNMVRVAQPIWECIREHLETTLTFAGEAIDNSLSHTENEDIERRADVATDQQSTCNICFTNVPNVFFISCGHAFCALCALRLFRCPACRVVITGRRNLYL
jgi:hypothetical protein